MTPFASQLDDPVLIQAAQRYEVRRADLLPLMVDEDTHLYAYDQGGHGFVQKWTSAEKNAAALRVEVDWVNYLADQGATVCQFVPSQQHRLVQVIATRDGYVCVVAQKRADGQRPTPRQHHSRRATSPTA